MWIVVLTVITISCVEIIDFDVERVGGILVVDGTITDTMGPHSITLRRTSADEKITDPVVGARITLHDEHGNIYDYIEIGEGTYEIPRGRVRGVPGTGYHVEIELQNGFKYRSDSEIMPRTIAEDSLFYEFDTVPTKSSTGELHDTEIIRLFKKTAVPESDEPVLLRWRVTESYKFIEFDFPDFFDNPPRSCYVTRYPEPQQIDLHDGSELSAGNLGTDVMLERPLDHTFYRRHYFNLIQYSLTRKAFAYWRQIDQIVNRSGTIFDVPPSSADGNIISENGIEEEVYGYFQAARVDTSRLFVVEADLPVNIFNPCSRLGRPECEDCLKLDNSSRQPPFYWLND